MYKRQLANLIIARTIDEEAKKELMKIDNPDMEKVRKAANTHKKKQKNSLKPTASTSKAFQIKRTATATTTNLSHATPVGRQVTSQ